MPVALHTSAATSPVGTVATVPDLAGTPPGAFAHREGGPVRVAVIGAGMAGSACAAGLARAGAHVTVFDEAHDVGGRTGTRQVGWTDAGGTEQSVTFDHGALDFAPVRPRFKAAMARAMAAGSAVRWWPRVHAERLEWPGPGIVAVPTMPALCHQLLAGAAVVSSRTVRRLQRAVDGGWYVVADGAPPAGPFHHVALAVPPAQAAVLLAGHLDTWADALMARRMDACWTLMAVTDDVDWPWDAAEPLRGPLARVLRNDRVPGRTAPRGMAVWTAHATAEWSAAHLEDDAQDVARALRAALHAQLPSAGPDAPPIGWHCADVHRWRHAAPAVGGDASLGRDGFIWSEASGLGVCGDYFSGGGVEAAWHSGDELADSMAAFFERIDTEPPAAATTRPR